MPLRVAVIGIDGAGKSTAVLLACRALGARYRVAKAGRNPLSVDGGNERALTPGLARFWEALFARADRTRNRWVIGASRVLFVLGQGLFEPWLIRHLRPEVVVNSRCMVIDPAVYLGVYFPRTRRLSLRSRLRLARLFTRLPFADLYVLLRTPAATAMQRIQARIARAPGYDREPRDYWLHLHEQEPILARIGDDLEAALAIAGGRSAVVRIETALHGEAAVAARIVEEVAGALDRLTAAGGRVGR